jgi:Flp pilus assembly protein TadD/4-amino-4-deoxy-L-arabinose transferase-like glycosyltransferase
MSDTEKKTQFCLLIILLAAACLRFTGLDWGTDRNTGTFHPFHPDETTIIDNSRWVRTDLRKIAAPYGKAPMYILWTVARITGSLVGVDAFDLTNNGTARFTYSIARSISAILGVLTVWITYKIGYRLGGPMVGLLSALFLAFSAGHIQQSHFYTVEVSFTFWITLSLYLMLKLPCPSRGVYIACGVASGLAAGTRLAGVWLGLPFIITHLWEGEALGRRWKKLLTSGVGYYLLAAFLVTASCEPFLLLDPNHFFGAAELSQMMGSIKAVTGESVYIWTLSDFATTPYLFHISNLLPLAFGTVLTGVSILGAILIVIKRPAAGIVILTWLLVYFLFIGRLHAKPFRYIIPMLPVLVVMGAMACGFAQETLRRRAVASWLVFLPILLVSLPTLSYGLAYTRIYHQEGSRSAALKWIKGHMGEGAHVLAERGGYPTAWMIPTDKYERRLDDATFFITSDGGIPYFRQIEFLKGKLDGIRWIVLIRENRMRQFEAVQDIFPIAHQFYRRLQDGTLGFEVVAEFKVIPGLAGITYDETGAEPTFTSFDHPHVVIYRLRDGYDLSGTMANWDESVRSDVNLPDIYVETGLKAYRGENWEEALKQFDRALQIKPGHVLGSILKRAAYLKLNGSDEAHNQWLTSSTYPTGKLIQSASSLHRMGLEEEEKEYLDYTNQQDMKAGKPSRFTTSYADIGNHLVKQERWPAAVGALTRAVSFGDAQANTWFLLARSYKHTGDFVEASNAISKALELEPMDTAYQNLHINLGTGLYTTGRIAEAREVYLKALLLDPTLAEACLNLGVLELGEGHLAEAERWLRRGTALSPDDIQIHLYLGVVLIKAGKPEPAGAAFRRVLSIDPNHQQAKSALQALNP